MFMHTPFGQRTKVRPVLVKSRSSRLGALVFACAFTTWGCEPAAGQKEPVFGGQGANVQASALPGGVDESVLHGPCSPAAPPGKVTLLDDFEDADSRPFKEFQREGYWYSAADSTQGNLSPKPNAFVPEALPEAESTPQNRMAAHFVASGYSDWGVVWGTTLRWVDQGTRCPFNASEFTGLRFKAKGTGRVRVNFGMPETIPPADEGKCKERCYDTHSRVVILTEKWETYEIPWRQLQQWGWGTQAKFDPTRLLNLIFAVDGKLLPVDFWVDDIEFMAAGVPNASAPGVETESAPSTPATETAPSTSPAPTTPAPTTPAPTTTVPASTVGAQGATPRL